MKTKTFIFTAVVVILTTAITTTLAKDRAHPYTRPTTKSRQKVKNEAERTAEFWNRKAQETITEKLRQTGDVKNQRAKNLILFLGDGMSVHTVTATRNLMGDSSKQVSFEKFPYFGLSKTYCVNRQVADSACTATAYLGGVKGNYGTIGVNAQVQRFHCHQAQNPANHVQSIAKWAQDANKDTGLVTTARVTHASPAGVYAHTPDREWEYDGKIIAQGCSAKDNLDIARQLIEWPVGKKLKVIMGGGRRNFRSARDEEGMPGLRSDGRDLIKEWLEEKRSNNLRAEYAWCKKNLRDLDLNSTDYLLGLFSNSHCPFHGDLVRSHIANANPSLSEMTEAAIKILQRNENGFFLFVEGARIDMAHHDTRARKALEDTEELAKAIQLARNMTSEDDTLIVVTSDHSHTMTINGYPNREQEITGLANTNGNDGLPYTILSYANGPGYYSTYGDDNGRKRLSLQNVNDPKFEYMASVPMDAETHGGDDVGVFASGPWAHYFSGNYEQTNIPAMMAKAANIGPFATA